MKVYREIVQGTPEWRKVRAGVVTGSGVGGVLTPKTLQPSASKDYLCRIVAERVLGEPLDNDGEAVNAWTERGTRMEAEARDWYAFDRGVTPELVGFVSTDDGRLGCSPDSLIGEDGGLEIKVPAAHTHVGYVMDPDSLAAAYRGQCQVFLRVTGRSWIDLVSYSTAFRVVVVRVVPDAEYQSALTKALSLFEARVAAAVEAVRAEANPLA